MIASPMTVASRRAPVWPAVAWLAVAWLLVPPFVSAQSAPDARVPASVRSAAADGRLVHIIVRLNATYQAEGQLDGPSALAQRARIRARVQQVLGRLPVSIRTTARPFQLIPSFAAEVDAATLTQLEADADVDGIEEDRRAAPSLAQSGPLIGAPAAWAAGYSGRGWTVAILDSGVDASHPFLAGKVVSQACYSNAGGSAGGISLCPGGTTSSIVAGSGLNCAFAACDHGTHVAGIAAGLGATFSGIARDATLISVQVFTRFDAPADCSSAIPCLLSYTSDEILALERVFALKDTYQIAAVNMSLGGGRFFDQTSCDAANVSLKGSIDQLRSVGIATVIAAGNDSYTDSMSAPACISSAISVGSSTKADQLSSFTNDPPFLSLLAPGSSITSSVPGGGFAVMSGTSMAAPHVAGAWALLKQRRPSASVSQVLAALQSTGVRLTDPFTGRSFPRIQVDAAAAALPLSEIWLDAPVSGATLTPPFAVTGWALDPLSPAGTGVDVVDVWAYPSSGAPIFVGEAQYGGARPDLAALFGPRFANAGFGLTATGLAPDTYQLVAFARSVASGAFDATRVIRVTVPGRAPDPESAIDTPIAGTVVPSTFTVAGWAIDRGSPSGTGVDVVNIYAYPNPGSGAAPIFLGTAAYGGTRSDVGSFFGPSFANSGYALAVSGLAPGPYRIVVNSHSTVTGVFAAQFRDVTVRTLGNPLMAIDTPAAGATTMGAFLIAGWAIDRDATSGSGVDLVQAWAYPVGGGAPIFLGSASLGGARSDVANAYGAAFAHAGYNLLAPILPAGTYDVVVYPHSAVTAAFTNSSVVRVSVGQ